MLLKVLIGWLLLAIAVAAILCRLIHKAKVADQAMRIPGRELPPGNRKADVQRSQGDY
ncbi:hypothetical protein ACSFE6_10150 [Pseudomonas baetica]|uniref:hypothetical protein n=1 Tax=Pseudomonas baetica TaxID=674054 RepID=UPI003EE8228E